MKNEILHEGLDKADYGNSNKIATLYILTAVFFIFSIICLCITISLESTIREQERQIKDRDSLNATLQVTNDTINYKLR